MPMSDEMVWRRFLERARRSKSGIWLGEAGLTAEFGGTSGGERGCGISQRLRRVGASHGTHPACKRVADGETTKKTGAAVVVGLGGGIGLWLASIATGE